MKTNYCASRNEVFSLAQPEITSGNCHPNVKIQQASVYRVGPPLVPPPPKGLSKGTDGVLQAGNIISCPLLPTICSQMFEFIFKLNII